MSSIKQISGIKRPRSESPDRPVSPPSLQPTLEIKSKTHSEAPSAAPSTKKPRHFSLNNYIKNFESMNSTVPFQNYIKTLKRSELPEPTPGGTSRVFIIKINNIPYAMKRVNITLFPDSVYKEIRSLLILNENNCNCAPILEAVVSKDEFIYLFMSYTNGKTLDNWLKTNPSEAEKASRHEELKAALAKIHGFNIIHADIKPSNIWIPDDPKISAYFIDFGSSIKEKEEEKANSFTVSPEGSPLESESATKAKNITALDKLFLKRGGAKSHRNRTKRKKLNHSRRHHRYY